MNEQYPKFARDYDEVLVGYNPESTGGLATLEFVKTRLARDELLLPVRYFKTDQDSNKMADVLFNEIEPGAKTNLAVIGGDWTINRVNAAHSILGEEIPNTVLSVIGGGGAQNLFKSAVSRENMSKPELILSLGEIVSFQTILMEIENQDGSTKVQEAMSTIGINGTAEMVDPTNQPEHRNSLTRNLQIGRHNIGKFIVDPPAIFDALIDASPQFEYITSQDELRTAFELMFLNTAWLGGILKAKQIELSGPVHYLEVEKKIDLVGHYVRLWLGKSLGHDLINPVTIRPTHDVMYQVDGETSDNGQPFILEAGSMVTFSQSQKQKGLVTLR